MYKIYYRASIFYTITDKDFAKTVTSFLSLGLLGSYWQNSLFLIVKTNKVVSIPQFLLLL